MVQKAALILIALVCTQFPRVSHAHDWFPEDAKWCCTPNRDCKPYPREALTRTLDGWVVKSTGQLFKDGARGVYPNERPDLGEVWICKLEWEPEARCIFIQPEGS